MCNNVSTYVPKLDFFPMMNLETAEVDVSIGGKVIGELKLETGHRQALPGQQNEDRKIINFENFHFNVEKYGKLSSTVQDEEILQGNFTSV